MHICRCELPRRLCAGLVDDRPALLHHGGFRSWRCCNIHGRRSSLAYTCLSCVCPPVRIELERRVRTGRARTYVFISLGLSGVIPVVHALLLYGVRPATRNHRRGPTEGRTDQASERHLRSEVARARRRTLYVSLFAGTTGVQDAHRHHRRSPLCRAHSRAAVTRPLRPLWRVSSEYVSSCYTLAQTYRRAVFHLMIDAAALCHCELITAPPRLSRFNASRRHCRRPGIPSPTCHARRCLLTAAHAIKSAESADDSAHRLLLID